MNFIRDIPLIGILLMVSSFANADLCRWTDERGVVNYGNHCPDISKNRRVIKVGSNFKVGGDPHLRLERDRALLERLRNDRLDREADRRMEYLITESEDTGYRYIEHKPLYPTIPVDNISLQP